NLFDRMLGHQTARLRQRLTNHRNRQRRAGHHAQCRVRQAIYPLGMKVMLIQVVDERADVLPELTKPTIRLLHSTLTSASTQYAVGNRAVFRLDRGYGK